MIATHHDRAARLVRLIWLTTSLLSVWLFAPFSQNMPLCIFVANQDHGPSGGN